MFYYDIEHQRLQDHYGDVTYYYDMTYQRLQDQHGDVKYYYAIDQDVQKLQDMMYSLPLYDEK